MTSPRPTAMELMQYADGELEEPRAAEVELWLKSNAQGRAVVASFGEIGELVRGHAEQVVEQGQADGIADQVMQRLDEAPKVVPLRPRGQASMIGYGLSGLALAAAAALVVWQIAGPSVSPLTQNTPSARPSQTGTPELIVASASLPPPDTEDQEQEPGVSVDAIEFGAHTGTIFYVPTDTGTTTVVWLTDDDTGDEK